MLSVLIALLAISLFGLGNMHLELGEQHVFRTEIATTDMLSSGHLPFLQIISIERIFETNHNK